VSAKRKSKKSTDTPREEWCFRHWVELRDLRDDTVRVLPVAVFQRIALVSKSKSHALEKPPELCLEVQDVGRVWKASSVDHLATQLREAYPDGVFVRTLKCERDREAEEKRRTALDSLAEILAEATVRRMLEDGPTKCGEKRVTESSLWLYLVREWKRKKMGSTGPTLPFLVGAARLAKSEISTADITDLNALLYSFQRVKSHHIRIAICGTLKQPVAAVYDRRTTMDLRELVELRKGESALYVSQEDYPHGGDIESATQVLWGEVGSAITSAAYSFNGQRYDDYTEKDRAYILGALADR
jgi:hypothetical protein